MTKTESKVITFEKSVRALEKSLVRYNDGDQDQIFFRDSAIQRFEMSFDLAWKTLKIYLFDKKGVTVKTPKDTFKEAFNADFIKSDNTMWLDMTDDRNLMSHVYDEDEAQRVFEKIPKYLVLFKELLEELRK